MNHISFQAVHYGLPWPRTDEVGAQLAIQSFSPKRPAVAATASSASFATQASLDVTNTTLAELQSDFDKLLAWVILNFGSIPEGLENDAESALNTYASN